MKATSSPSTTPFISMDLHQSFPLADQINLIHFMDLSKQNAQALRQWRNHPAVRRWMFNSEWISPEEHQQFLDQLSQFPQRAYWLLRQSGQDIGVINFHQTHTKYGEWGFYLKPELRGTQQSIQLVNQALQFFFGVLKVSQLYGWVHQRNLDALVLHDLFYIEYNAAAPLCKDRPSSDYEYREIHRTVWLEQKLDLNKLHKRLLNKQDYFYTLKRETLARYRPNISKSKKQP